MNLVFFDWTTFYQNLPQTFRRLYKVNKISKIILNEEGVLLFEVADKIMEFHDENAKRLRGFCIAAIIPVIQAQE